MKKFITVFLCIVLGVLFSLTAVACNNNTQQTPTDPDSGIQTPGDNNQTPEQPGNNNTGDDNNSETPTPPTGNNILIAYFTAEYGNTERIANYIHEKIGGDIVKIEAAQPYTAQELNYSIKNNRPEVEKAENARPEIAQTTYDKIEMSQYDTVFIGYPIWWWTAPMIIGTFLEHYDLTGKDIYPFTQSGSMNVTHFNTSMEFVRECAAKNGTPTVHDGLFTKTNSVIDEYLDDIEFSVGFNLAKPTPGVAQTIELWEEGKIPSWRRVSNNDPADFRPTLEYRPVASGVQVKGAVVLCAGGAFAFRGNWSDTYPTANRLTALGYQCFVVQYRLSPFTQAESALDLARAVRYVRFYADEYGIDAKDIAIVGYSAGGILCGEHALNWKGTVSPTLVDSNYVPDALDKVNADVAAVGHIYSFYGRLSVSNNNVNTLRAGNLPPTFYAYGTEDPFYSQFNQNVAAVKEAGVEVESHVYQGQPHGFGAGNANSNWIPDFDRFLSNIYENN